METREQCDRCLVAEAKYQATKDELKITLCGHHGRKYELVLLTGDWKIVDLTAE